MPHELQLEEVTDNLLERTLVVYRKGTGEGIKYKLRTKSTLFTVKVSQEDSGSMESKITDSGQPIEIIDV